MISKNIVTLSFLILQSFFLSSASCDKIVKSQCFHKSSGNYTLRIPLVRKFLFASEPVLPEIPPRPTIHELLMSIKNTYTTLNKPIVVDKSKEDYKLTFVDNEGVIEKSYRLKPDILFSLLLEVVMDENLNVESLSVINKQCVIFDKFRNKFFLKVLSDVDKNSILKVHTRRSFFGSIIVDKTMKNLLSKIDNIVERSSGV